MKPSIVSNKNPVDFGVFLLIIELVIAFQLYVTVIQDKADLEFTITIVWIATPLIAAIASFLVFKRYGWSMVFGKAYLALGLGFVMLMAAEISYIVYDFVLLEDPYPSIADVFYFAFYFPFALYHLRTNIKFFNPDASLKVKSTLAGIAASIMIIFSLISYNALGELNFDYFYGLIFVSVASITLSYTILGALSFKGGTIGIAWLILVTGMLLFTIGDTFYYYLELFGGYTVTHFVNLFWIAGYMIIVYALYKHIKAI